LETEDSRLAQGQVTKVGG